MLAWSNKYSTGIRQIDGDHVILVSLLNQLHINLSEEKTEHALEPVLAALINYADYHFKREERLMDLSRYPDRVDHQAAHDAFRARIGALLERAGQPAEVGRRLRALLSQWLFDHIVRADGKLGDWLRAHPVGEVDGAFSTEDRVKKPALAAV